MHTQPNLMASFTADTASLVAPYIFNRFACLWQDDVFAGMDAGHDLSVSNGPVKTILVAEGKAGHKKTTMCVLT